jgi:hypothetical protein
MIYFDRETARNLAKYIVDLQRRFVDVIQSVMHTIKGLFILCLLMIAAAAIFIMSSNRNK